MGCVGLLSAGALSPFAFVAITRTRSVWPESAEAGV